MGCCHCVEWRYKNIFSSFEAWRYSETLPKISSEKWMKELLRSCHSFTPYVNDFEKFHTNERAVLPEYYWNNTFLTLNTSKTSTSKSKCNNNMMSFKVSVNLTWWIVAQSIVRHAPNIYQCVCESDRVREWLTQLHRFGNTEPYSQAILTTRVGVCQDINPEGKEMRGSRDDGGWGGLCTVVIAWTSNNPEVPSVWKIWRDCVGCSEVVQRNFQRITVCFTKSLSYIDWDISMVQTTCVLSTKDNENYIIWTQVLRMLWYLEKLLAFLNLESCE